MASLLTRLCSPLSRFVDATQPDGRLADQSAHSDDGFSTFFSETGNGKHVPRSLYVRRRWRPLNKG